MRKILFALALPLAAAACAQPSATGARVTSLGAGPLTAQALIGAAPSAVSARLGAPDFRRTEPSAEIWQYGGRDCSLFLYFYGQEGARHVDARRLQGGPADKDQCLASVMAKRNAPVS
ncbi:hypothetical protein [Parvibaculum sp.]|uniref:hypothetical protein n=1 Tax=Parvibaculum sp. TaxID=2024848 RepID=UPI00391CC3F0